MIYATAADGSPRTTGGDIFTVCARTRLRSLTPTYFLLKVTATGPAPLTAQIVDKGDGTYNGYYTVPNVTGTWDFTFWYRSVFKVGGGPYTITSVGMFVASATSV